MTPEQMADMLVVIRLAFKELQEQVNNLEVVVDTLRVQYDRHDHPYKPEPRYGGIFGG